MGVASCPPPIGDAMERYASGVDKTVDKYVPVDMNKYV